MDDEKFPTPDRLPDDLPPLKTDDDESDDLPPDPDDGTDDAEATTPQSGGE